MKKPIQILQAPPGTGKNLFIEKEIKRTRASAIVITPNRMVKDMYNNLGFKSYTLQEYLKKDIDKDFNLIIVEELHKTKYKDNINKIITKNNNETKASIMIMNQTGNIEGYDTKLIQLGKPVFFKNDGTSIISPI